MQVDVRGRFQPPVRVIGARAHVVGELRGVVPKAEPIIGLVVVAVTQNQLALAVSFKTSIRSDIENTIYAVAILGRETSRLRLQVRNVFRVELRPQV